MRRIPLWWTLLPLAFGLAAYWHLWSGYRDTFRADIVRLLPGATVTIGGFPYRMEAEVAAPVLGRSGDVLVSLAAAHATLNRGPWQRELTVIRTVAPRVTVSFAPLARASARIEADLGLSSLHIGDGRVVRLSNVFSRARIGTGLFDAAITADRFEVHLRQTPARSNESWSPTPPQQAQMVLVGTAVRIGNGAPLTLNADIAVTAIAPLSSLAAWTEGGTVEIRSLVLADPSGEVVRLAASAVPAAGQLRLAGTITTVCPATVRAAFDHRPAPRESRLRLPVRLAFSGSPGMVVLQPAATSGDIRSVRAQLPPCPALR